MASIPDLVGPRRRARNAVTAPHAGLLRHGRRVAWHRAGGVHAHLRSARSRRPSVRPVSGSDASVHHPRPRLGTQGTVSSAEQYTQLREGTEFYSSIAYAAGSPAIVSGPAGSEDVWTEMTSGNLFSLLGVRPALGRFPDVQDHDPAGAVVSQGLWQRQFAGRRTLAGATITVDDRTYSVIGVLPPAITDSWDAAVWLPGPSAPPPAAAYWVRSVVRLKPGISPTQVRAELAVVAARLTNTYGNGPAPFAFRLLPLTPPPAPLRATHDAMVAAAIAVLLLACANLGSLMLARGLSRRQELAVRLALGATRDALTRLLAAESVVMSALGAILGAALAIVGLHLLEYRMPATVASIGILVPATRLESIRIGVGCGGSDDRARRPDSRLANGARDGRGTSPKTTPARRPVAHIATTRLSSARSR